MNWLLNLVEKKYGKHGSYYFYRCNSCHHLITASDIKKGGCSCGGTSVSPTNPSILEEIFILGGLLWKKDLH